jgi:Stress responsive A/B Barrel Domain
LNRESKRIDANFSELEEVGDGAEGGRTMFVHSVYFWLKPELTDAQRADFRCGLESLGTIKSVASFYIGTPAPIPPRPVVDSSYTFGLTVMFKDVAGHDAYQIDAIHKVFLDQFRTYWARVQIYDAL